MPTQKKIIQFGFGSDSKLLQAKQFQHVFDTVHLKIHQPSFTILVMFHSVLPYSLNSTNSSAFETVNGEDQPTKRMNNSTETTQPITNQYPSGARIGFIVAKKKIKRAHERNRVKRITRDSFRLNRSILPLADLVFIAKADAQHVSNDVLHAHLTDAWLQLQQKSERFLMKHKKTI